MSIPDDTRLTRLGVSWACVSSQAAALFTASIPSLFCCDSRARLLPHRNVPAAFSAVLPSFANFRRFCLQLLTELYLTGTNAPGFAQLRPKYYRLTQHP